MQQLPDHVVSKIFTAINLNFICQSQPQADRRLCYQLMNVMMDKKPTGKCSSSVQMVVLQNF